MRNLSALTAIRESAELIKEWTKDGIDAFVSDQCVRAAVERKFEVIGTAVKSLRNEVQPQHPDLEWDQFVELKDLIGRNYTPANAEKLWQVISQSLEPFARRVGELERNYREQSDRQRSDRQQSQRAVEAYD